MSFEVPFRNTDVWKVKEGYVYVLHDLTGTFYKLNELGSEIWQSIDGKNRIQDITALISESYPETASETIKNDVEEFIRHLSESKLIEWREPTNQRAIDAV